MKKLNILVLSGTVLFSGWIVSPVALATGSLNIPVSATLAPMCRWITASPAAALNIANSGTNIDPSLATTASGVANVYWACTKDTRAVFSPAALITLSNSTTGSTMMLTRAGHSWSTLIGQGLGHQILFQLFLDISSAQFANKPAGLYTGNYLVTISP